MQTTSENSSRDAAQTPPPAVPHTLDSLASKSFDHLEVLYLNAPAPTSLRPLDGDLVGRMLAVKVISGTPLGSPIRQFAASKAFVWGGKSFASESDTAGKGINRVKVPSVLGRQRLFPFETLIGPSALDGRPAIILNYDLPENPPYIQKIHDEVREVSPGLYLGPAMWKGASSKTTVLWFALDTGKR
jgi:hypothetical protein